MKYFVYILRSDSSGNFYIGQTQNIAKRLIKHNKGYVRSTKNRGPWIIIYDVSCASRSEAMALEKKLKNFKSQHRLQDWIINNKL